MKRFERPDKEELRRRLTPLQWEVTQNSDNEQYMKMARHAPLAILVCGDTSLALKGDEQPPVGV
ncbi:MAG: hypothetical protein LIP02_11520 [Bacteroidales bacterium]|nr:hypothetical protein [Bacteroidales bacterium]